MELDVEKLEAARSAPDKKEYDLIILGAGPAGMTAAVYAARKQIPTLLISRDVGGQLLLTAQIENYMGYQFITGFELMAKFQEQVNLYPLDLRLGEDLKAVTREEGGFRVRTTGGGEYTGRALVLATGKRSRPLEVPGEEELVGRGVSYCAICDGPFFKEMDVAVVGGGNSALEAVLDLMKWARKVYLIHRSEWTADQILVERVMDSDKVEILRDTVVREIHGDRQVESVSVEPRNGGRRLEIPVQGVFIEIGLIPNTEALGDLVALNEYGEIMVDCQCRTNVPGVFAAGDVTNVPDKQIVVAAGEGAKASLGAFRFLVGVHTGDSWK